MQVLFIGDIVGAPGRRAVRTLLPLLRKRYAPALIVANAENAAGGQGITPALCDELLGYGVDVLTLGDHVWDQKDLAPRLRTEPRVLRPINLPPDCPGRGWITCTTPMGPVTVTCALGRVFMPPIADCPFRTLDRWLSELPSDHGPVLVDIHAEATSEKAALAWYLDGRVALVAGTHTHVATADERVLPRGTAFISDVGMTGPVNSVIGRDVESILGKFLTGMPVRFKVARGPAQLSAVVVEINGSGRADRIVRVAEACTDFDEVAEPS